MCLTRAGTTDYNHMCACACHGSLGPSCGHLLIDTQKANNRPKAAADPFSISRSTEHLCLYSECVFVHPPIHRALICYSAFDGGPIVLNEMIHTSMRVFVPQDEHTHKQWTRSLPIGDIWRTAGPVYLSPLWHACKKCAYRTAARDL